MEFERFERRSAKKLAALTSIITILFAICLALINELYHPFDVIFDTHKGLRDDVITLLGRFDNKEYTTYNNAYEFRFYGGGTSIIFEDSSSEYDDEINGIYQDPRNPDALVVISIYLESEGIQSLFWQFQIAYINKSVGIRYVLSYDNDYSEDTIVPKNGDFWAERLSHLTVNDYRLILEELGYL